ncbi:ATP-binding protein [Chlorobaculum sp. MV4-Y]|uniref:hybrid sensor histidine kinase/response regulator n=1 Tax=Chlorobaculum sp. MV4-Y TaxID=2976335 RepID=UPI0021B00C19|nr:hybrid sensor histidine kinase/response regulator [Chlorobaculum sp. MV4-Y]UWX58336.1 ATP-binding protein [Chlorobaculum sp. MV4-Y]
MSMPVNDLDSDLFKDFPEQVFVMAPDGTILAADRFFPSNLESIYEHIVERNIFDLLVEINAAPEVLPSQKDATCEALRIGKHLALDDPTDGSRWKSSIYPVFDDSGNIEKLMVLVQNVTKQKLSEEEIEKFRTKMVSVLENSHVSIWTHNIDNNIILRALEHDRFFGYDSLVPDWKIERFFSHIHPDDRPMVMGVYETSLKHQSDFNVECRIQRTDGQIRWINLVGTFRCTKPDSSRYIIGIILDVTEKKLTELELERLQAQLQHAQKMEIIGQLAGGIAHDFNNSLTAIIGNIELALTQIDPTAPVADYLRDAQRSAQRSADRTSQLLGFARKQMRLPQVVSLNREIDRLIPMLKPLMLEQIECIWTPGENIPEIFIDPTQLHQILSNLYINSRDAIKDFGTITISTGSVRIRKSDCKKGHICQKPGNYATITVSDTGCGIDSKALPHIFEPFFTTKPVGKGSGLGLSTVYGIVRQNNGYIGCHSEKGKGTTFTIFLPKYRNEVPKPMPKIPEGSLKAQKNTVLLVEDEPGILNILKVALNDMEFKVFDALDAESALAIVETQKEKIDLLVTDIVLPRMNGIELSKQLLSIMPGMKFLFMSGFFIEKNENGDQPSKAVNFIRKPFTIHDFMAMVYKVMLQP